MELANLGHNVTVFAPDKDQSDTPNLHFIWAEKVYETTYAEDENVNEKYGANPSPFKIIKDIWPGVFPMCQGLHDSDGFKQLMNYPKDFKVDLLMVDLTIGPCWAGFLHKFKYPPLVGFTAFEIPDYIYDFMDGHSQPAYIPHQTAQFANNMDFFERFTNFYVKVFEHL